jgi:hypothetical protein
MYTTFFAVLSLLYFAVENADSATAHEILRDATAGRDALAQLAKRSMAADRCTKTLNVSVLCHGRKPGASTDTEAEPLELSP